MEVTAGENVAFAVGELRVLHEHEGVIDGGVYFRFKHGAAVGKRIADCAVYLRDTAQRVGVLYTSAVAMRVADLAALEQAAKVGSGPRLAGMRTRFVNAFVVGDVGAFEGVSVLLRSRCVRLCRRNIRLRQSMPERDALAERDHRWRRRFPAMERRESRRD